MKLDKHFWISLTTVFCLTVTIYTVHADYSPQDIVNQFNGGMNGDGPGFKFSTYTRPEGLGYGDDRLRRLLFEPRDTEVVNTNAYTQGNESDLGLTGIYDGKIYFATYRCPRSNQAQTLDGYARLNYNKDTDETFYRIGDGYHTLPLAYACLYAQFVRGNFESTFDVTAMRMAIDMILEPDDYTVIDWMNNMYLRFLLDHTPDRNGRSNQELIDQYWLAAYKLTGEYYVDIDGQPFDLLANCYVFVMGVIELPSGSRGTSMMYAALRSDDDPPGDAPEPATLLLWTLGGLGLAGTSWHRKRKKKLALA